MNSCVIVTFFPQNLEQEFLLSQCLNSLKHFGKKIILVSHKEINQEIQKLCDYYIYDKENELIKPEQLIKSDPINFLSDLEINHNNYKVFSLNSILVLPAVLKSLNIATNFAKSLGYEWCHYVVGDIVFDEQDYGHIFELEQKILQENKLGYFEKVRSNHSYEGLETVYWISKIDWFMQNFLSVYKLDELLKVIDGDFYLERFFHKRMIPFFNQIICVQKDYDSNFVTFSKSENLGKSLNGDFGKFIFTLVFMPNSNSYTFIIHNSIPYCKVVDCEIYYNASGKTGLWTPVVPEYVWMLCSLDSDAEDFIDIRCTLKNGDSKTWHLDTDCLQKIKELSKFF